MHFPKYLLPATHLQFKSPSLRFKNMKNYLNFLKSSDLSETFSRQESWSALSRVPISQSMCECACINRYTTILDRSSSSNGTSQKKHDLESQRSRSPEMIIHTYLVNLYTESPLNFFCQCLSTMLFRVSHCTTCSRQQLIKFKPL